MGFFSPVWSIKRQTSDREDKKAVPGVVNTELKKEIVKWRKEVWTRYFRDSLFGPSAILCDAAVESVSSFGKIKRLIDLESALGGWA